MDDNDSIITATTPLGIVAQIAYWYIAIAFMLGLYLTIYELLFGSLNSGAVYYFFDTFIDSLSWPSWFWNTLF